MQAQTQTTTTTGDADRLAMATTGLEPDSALALRSAFESMFAQADRWVEQAKLIHVTSIDQKREMKLARESRLALREIRVKAEHARKRLKEDSTRRGKAIDGIANVLKALIEPIEEHLLEQETFAERADAERRGALKMAREEALRAYGADVTAFANLGETSDETWALTLENAKVAHGAKLQAARDAAAVRVEAEKLAAEAKEKGRLEAIRLKAERAERERVQLEENARLKAEATAREEAACVERELAAKEKAVAVAIARAAEDDRARAEASLAAERKAAAELVAEVERVKARHEAERVAAEQETRRKHEEDVAARAAAETAPDREKLALYVAGLCAVPVPSFTSARGKLAGRKVAEQFGKFVGWLAKTGEAL